MADEPRPGVAGLGQVFADFDLLPDLLQGTEDDDVSGDRWTAVLERHGFSDGHVYPGDVQALQPGGLVASMAADARRMCERLGLLTPEGELTEPGYKVADAAKVPLRERPSELMRAAATAVGEQIRRRYVGADGLELASLVQQASEQVAVAIAPLWADLPGLVLAEFDTVLYWGLVDASRARELPEELPRVRRDLVDRLEQGSLRRRDLRPGTFCDAITYWHCEQEDLAFRSTLLVTELRVTAMAMAWSELLSETFGDFEISVLAPTDAAA